MERFGLSPLIRVTLLSLYLALVLPLHVLAPEGLRVLMTIGLLLGFGLVFGLLSEQVDVGQDGIQVGYPIWIRWLLRRGWTMAWEDMRALVPVGTSQGGTVYYLKTADLKHQLLPQRIARFEHFLQLVRDHSGVDTKGIGRLTPPWTYQVLAALSILMLIAELVFMGWGIVSRLQ